MKTIELTQGKVAIVDDEDYEYLNQWKWCAVISRKTHYAHRRDGKAGIKMHREIIRCKDGLVVDHIDRNGLNNTKANLRVCTNGQNISNTGNRKHRKNKGIYPQVYKDSVYWIAQIKHNKKHIYLGSFKTERDACVAYNAKVLELRGEFAVLNELP